ncbi:hypothetical protein CAC42_6819 [Sphaceloma murrayae]|uniref:Uncharacterized protein n=1 Tax=Sphaceloma murrayae TaxID=2082308 RepID=A0A2K1QGL5_9PEZI|nr:hypothetical protein CAC42_6819 [Sphaceloma murrayae]
MVTVRPAHSWIAESQPSCVACIPSSPGHFVIGTYTLDDPSTDSPRGHGEAPTDTAESTSSSSEGEDKVKPQKRRGQLLTYHDRNEQCTEDHSTRITLDSGILDIVFSPHDHEVLFVATSEGSLAYLRVIKDPRATDLTDNDLGMDLICMIQVFDPSILILDLVFHPTREDIIGVTTSTGGIYLLQVQHLPKSFFTNITAPISISLAEVYRTTLEAWTLSFSPDGSALYFGSDDSALGTAQLLPAPQLIFTPSPDPDPEAASDTLLSSPHFRHQSPVQTCDPSTILTSTTSDTRTHGAGVVSILPLHSSSSNAVLLTGSYDDHIRVVRPSAPPVGRCLASLDLEGGVWRTSLVAHHMDAEDEGRRKWLVLVACMHAGAKIVEISCERWKEAIEGRGEGDGGFGIRVVAAMEEHGSMCYAAETIEGPMQARTRGVVSASFYDKLCCAWKFEGPDWMAELEEEQGEVKTTKLN